MRGRSGPFALRDDVIRLPDGTEAVYTVLTNPDSAFVVPRFENGDTVLVRQWRHAWDESSWEVPAGTFNGNEEPLACARRELGEETGLVAARYTSLGVVHGAAFLTGSAHLFLAEGITESDRNPETYEQDMEVLRLPFVEALESALKGQIVHSGSITALCRAARKLELL
ncbi:MAG TPA: NUDIX hydrolase [Candidatus Dormibacteraeota bacterium]|nr:NUDIX hydrolase [Candidatus Dormibacteraeota bacterium]